MTRLVIPVDPELPGIPKPAGLIDLHDYARDVVTRPVAPQILASARRVGTSIEWVYDAHDRARDALAALPPGHFARLSAYEAMPPGVIDHRIWEAEDGRVWIDQFRVPRVIDDPDSLSDAHLWNVLRWIAASADRLLDGWMQMWAESDEERPPEDALDFILARPTGRALTREVHRRRLA